MITGKVHICLSFTHANLSLTRLQPIKTGFLELSPILFLSQAGIIPDRLLIALEPEAASIYCKHIDLANFSGVGANFKPFAAGSRYVILDAGGM